MKLKKILTAIAATAVMTSLFAIGASAAGEITGVSYDATSGKVSFTLPAYTADQKTLLIVKTAADGSYNLGALLDTDIMQIDQNGTGWTEAQLEKNLAVGTKFVVLSGGNGTLYSSAMYEVTSGGSEYYNNGEILLGDATKDGFIASDDALMALDYTVGVRYSDKDVLQALDVTDDTYVASDDALVILDYTVGDRTKLGTKKIKDKANFVDVSSLNAE